MGGRGSAGGRGGGGGATPKKIHPEGTPFLKNLNDPKEADALRKKTIKDIEDLQRETNWYNDKRLNYIKDSMRIMDNRDAESILELADSYFRYKPKYLNMINRF